MSVNIINVFGDEILLQDFLEDNGDIIRCESEHVNEVIGNLAKSLFDLPCYCEVLTQNKRVEHVLFDFDEVDVLPNFDYQIALFSLFQSNPPTTLLIEM